MEFKDIINAVFFNRSKWATVTDKDKIDNFFIFNQRMAKKYPKQAEALNAKNVDKATAMDIWYLHFKDKYGIPVWYGVPKKKSSKLDKTDIHRFIERYWVRKEDIEILNLLCPDELKEEFVKLKRIEDNYINI